MTYVVSILRRKKDKEQEKEKKKKKSEYFGMHGVVIEVARERFSTLSRGNITFTFHNSGIFELFTLDSFEPRTLLNRIEVRSLYSYGFYIRAFLVEMRRISLLNTRIRNA